MAAPRKGRSSSKAAPKLEERLAALRALELGEPGDEGDAVAPEAQALLRDALRSGSGVLAAAAAKRIAEHRIQPLVEELAPGFQALIEDGAQRDPGCRGKIAISRALHELDEWEERVFVAGLTLEQLEGWGTRDDTAAELRGVCGLAHAHFGHASALAVLADLLADRERITRVAAAQGLGDAGHPDAAALLRYKLRVGDPEPDVLTACAESYLRLARADAVALLYRFLSAHDDRAEVAALALGGARVSGAAAHLVAWCAGCVPEQRHRIGYLSLALLRDEPATEHLLGVIREHPRDAAGAARALATFKDDAQLCDRIRAAAAERDEKTRREIDAILA